MNYTTLFATCFALLVPATYTEATIRIGTTTVGATNMDYLNYARHLRIPAANQVGAVWVSGNDVTGKTAAEIATIVLNHMTTLETDLDLKIIYNTMHNATEVFAFLDLSAAQKEFTLRKTAVQKLIEMNSNAPGTIGTRGSFYWYNADDKKHETAADKWTNKDAEKYGMFYWYQKPGTTAYDAIAQICTPTIYTEGECYTAICVCVWWGQSRALGAAGFNAKWPSTSWLTRLVTWYVIKNWGGNYSSKMTRSVIGTDVHVTGDWIYMLNHNYGQVIDKRKNKLFYDKGWLNKEWSYLYQGENALVGASPTEGGSALRYHGLGAANKTEDGLRIQMRETYNTELKKVIDNFGKIDLDGDGVRETLIFLLEAKPEHDALIKWVSHQRIHN